MNDPIRVPDKYDEAIARLTARPEWIRREWMKGRDLFKAAGPLHKCGCLTQIRQMEHFVAATPELTEAIRADVRIPRCPEEITVQHLSVFAEWQRRLDRELGQR